MSIVDYKARSKQTQEIIFNDPNISDQNKEHLRRFLIAYDVTPARETIFLSNIHRFLTRTQDVQQDMNNPEKISLIFKDLKSQYSEATLDTIKAVASTFCKWLNKGSKPAGFMDVKRFRKDQLRQLNPDDMITWEEGKHIANQTPSVQIKAAFLTQLDCGFRPSEFLGLNYGDVKIDNDIVIFNVKEGKTGSRQVWMYRAVPQFLAWYGNHPTKSKNDPLWIMENTKNSHRIAQPQAQKIERYNYHTLLKRFNLMYDRAEIDKPKDFYNLRHSSCTLDKRDNVPLDEAATRHGHSVKHFVETYGRMDMAGRLERVRQVYGKPEEKKTLLRNFTCERCKAINEPEAEFCQTCGTPLSVKKAGEIYKQNKEMMERLNEMDKKLLAMAELDPRYMKAVQINRGKK